jgi:hypothetical protein
VFLAEKPLSPLSPLSISVYIFKLCDVKIDPTKKKQNKKKRNQREREREREKGKE